MKALERALLLYGSFQEPHGLRKLNVVPGLIVAPNEQLATIFALKSLLVVLFAPFDY
jgi:hypothetical protein